MHPNNLETKYYMRRSCLLSHLSLAQTRKPRHSASATKEPKNAPAIHAQLMCGRICHDDVSLMPEPFWASCSAPSILSCMEIFSPDARAWPPAPWGCAKTFAWFAWSSEKFWNEIPWRLWSNVKQVASASVSEATPIIAEKPGTCGTLCGAWAQAFLQQSSHMTRRPQAASFSLQN